MQDIFPTRSDKTIVIPTSDKFLYSNHYCPFIRYHIYQDYPSLHEKLQGHFSCGAISSQESMTSMRDYDQEYKSHDEMILMACQKKCNDEISCLRFAFGKVGADDEKNCYLYNSDTCGYVKNSGEKRIYTPSKLTQNIFIKNFDNDRTITYTSANDGSFWFQLGVETQGGKIFKFPTHFLI